MPPMATMLADKTKKAAGTSPSTQLVSGIERLLYVACAQKKKLNDNAIAVANAAATSDQDKQSKMKPLDFYPMHKQLGALLEASGLLPEARTHFKAALTLRPLDIGICMATSSCSLYFDDSD